MTTLWQIIILMTVMACLFLVVPVWRFRQAEKRSGNEVRKEQNRELFQQGLADLEEDLAQAQISPEEFEKLKIELQRGFMEDMEAAQNTQSVSAASGNKPALIFLALVIPVMSFFVYQSIGSSRELVLPELIAQVGSAETEVEMSLALDKLAVALDDRFSRRPDDVVNGYQLGNIYLRLERYQTAATTYRGLAATMEDNPDKATVLGQLAQAEYLLADSALSAETEVVMAQALALDPNQYSVLTILAVEAFVKEDFAAAVGFWRRQLMQEASGSAQAAMLAQRIAQVEALLPEGSIPAVAEGGASISVYVDIDDSIRDQIGDDMRLFIFARGETMPLPLAAQTFSVAELPITITLDDSMAMTPQFTLSSTERAYVGASIGRTAVAESGDFRAVSETFVVAEQEETIRILITDMVP